MLNLLKMNLARVKLNLKHLILDAKINNVIIAYDINFAKRGTMLYPRKLAPLNVKQYKSQNVSFV